jgi:prophage antirepressor-like protein
VSELQHFDVEGYGWRFGQDADGAAWAVAADVAKSFDQRDADKVTRLLEEDEKGTRMVGTPGGPQEMKVVFEDGIWELIFRSTKPGAKAIKKRVKAILREIRETGSYSAEVERPMSEIEMARNYVAALEREETLKLENAKLRVKAEAFDLWINGKGCYLVGTVAKMLNLGPKALWTFLYDEKILINNPASRRHREPYSRPDLKDWFDVEPVPPEKANGHATKTTVVTPYGAEQIRLRLIKRGLLPPDQLALIEGSA